MEGIVRNLRQRGYTTLTTLALVLLIIAAMFVPQASAEPTWSPDGRQVAFIDYAVAQTDIDLGAEISGPDNLVYGGVATLTVVAYNWSQQTAHNVVVSVTLPETVRITGLDQRWGCSENMCIANVGDVSGLSSKELTIAFEGNQAAGEYAVTAYVDSDDADFSPSDNTFTKIVKASKPTINVFPSAPRLALIGQTFTISTTGTVSSPDINDGMLIVEVPSGVEISPQNGTIEGIDGKVYAVWHTDLTKGQDATVYAEVKAKVASPIIWKAYVCTPRFEWCVTGRPVTTNIQHGEWMPLIQH